ncbi:DUF2971 domain-containing protein [Bacillus mycoides]|uniref:DUF2971 domain-containing protein n=1 Tax=Bacillus mycoides TaxID=1405 RepID=UPI003D1F5272
MGYDLEQWKKRVQYRTDLSGVLYHLTKCEIKEDGKVTLNALDRLIKILVEGKINGSSTESGFIIGDRKAVCFQDAPMSGIVQNIVHEEEFRKELGGKIRYRGIGIAFSKSYIFRNGGRPVLYEEKSKAKIMLPREEWWRIVNFNLVQDDNIIDWTHEREWRMPEDEFHFDVSDVVVLLPNTQQYRSFIERCPKEILKKIKGIVQLGLMRY